MLGRHGGPGALLRGLGIVSKRNQSAADAVPIQQADRRRDVRLEPQNSGQKIRALQKTSQAQIARTERGRYVPSAPCAQQGVQIPQEHPLQDLGCGCAQLQESR